MKNNTLRKKADNKPSIPLEKDSLKKTAAMKVKTGVKAGPLIGVRRPGSGG